jgi:hypothetical protein
VDGDTFAAPVITRDTVAVETAPPDEIFAMSSNNRTRDILKIAADVLAAKLAMARNERSQAIAQLRDAVATQDSLKYGEPPMWFYPVRESLGAAMFLDGSFVKTCSAIRGIHTRCLGSCRYYDPEVEPMMRDLCKLS